MPGRSAEFGSAGHHIFVCDWIPPEFGAVGQYTLKRARTLAHAGARVTLIGLGRQQSSEFERLGAGELRIVRLTAPRNPKESFTRRALWALGMNAQLMRATEAAQKGERSCTILVTGSPPLLSYWLLLQNLLFWRKHVVYRTTDFYPEVALAAGKARWLTLVKPVFSWLRRAAYQIEVLGVDQARRLAHDPEIASRLTLRGLEPATLFGTPIRRRSLCASLFRQYGRGARDGHDLRGLPTACAVRRQQSPALGQCHGSWRWRRSRFLLTP
jgi:hypothetical protein